MKNNIFSQTNQQKILFFLIKSPNQLYLEREIQKTIKISKAGVNFSLRDLRKKKLVSRQRRGNTYFYKVDYSDPIIKQLKILQNVISLKPLIEKIKEEAIEIILFGSSSRGEDLLESDLDLFILANDKLLIKETIKNYKIEKRIQMIIKTPSEFLKLEKKDKVFYKEIKLGIMLYSKE